MLNINEMNTKIKELEEDIEMLWCFIQDAIFPYINNEIPYNEWYDACRDVLDEKVRVRDSISNCNECFYHEIFESIKIKDIKINYCHSKGHRIYMISSITECLEWGIHHGKEVVG